MPAVTTSYLPEKALFAGEVSDKRKPVTVKSGQNLAKNTLVMTDNDGKVVAHNGNVTIKPAGVLAFAVNASAGDAPGIVYPEGDFAMDVVVWPANVLVPTYTNNVISAMTSVAITTLLKQKLLEGTEMYAIPYVAGDY